MEQWTLYYDMEWCDVRIFPYPFPYDAAFAEQHPEYIVFYANVKEV